jgi:predicted glycogen debranching enzyme
MPSTRECFPDPIQRVAIDASAPHRQEWLVCNGLGGYASGTVLGVPTRRYHGYLIAALPNPAGRMMMLSSLWVQLELERGEAGRRVDVGWVPPSLSSGSALELVDFTLELGLPVWRYHGHGVTLERRIVLPYGQNTTLIVFRLLEGAATCIELRPSLQFRGHDEPVSTAVPDAYPLTALGARIELRPVRAPGAQARLPVPCLRLHLHGQRPSFVTEPVSVHDIAYPTEESRGYASRGQLSSPGRFCAELSAGTSVALIASTEPWDTIATLTTDQVLATETERRRQLIAAADPIARSGAAAELVLAADQFVVRPVGRDRDDEPWTIIAGYHWFSDWGRDTMIALEGLTLVTGRVAEARSILRTFANHVRDGLVPNLFPEGASEGLYHTADATLWLFHAIDRYMRASGDHHTLVELLPLLRDIIEHHRRGTRFGIGVDASDGLLVQGTPGLPLTWMDAKAGDWVVTPRRGKAVEINALWYNALRLMADWLTRTGDTEGAQAMTEAAQRTHRAFNARFWNAATGCLYDVVDGEHGDDASIRPNQLFAISLPHPVLDPVRWRPVLDVVERDLLTPLGVRSLAPSSPDFKPAYRGDRIARDAAYHQGTVWSWLIGPYVDAVMRVRPDDLAGARRALDGLIASLDEACIGNISEVSDAEPPHAAGGCVAQAWAIAELLRCLSRTAR